MIASSVCGEVGFAAMEVLARVVLATAGWEGAWRRRNFTSVGNHFVSISNHLGGGERRDG